MIKLVIRINMILILSALSSGFLDCQPVKNPVKPRTIITTDGEVDDIDSFIRLLLYSSEYSIEGLIYSGSQWHYAGDGKGTLFTSEMPSTAKRYGQRTDLRWPGTGWMQQLIDKYADSYPNLVKHDVGFPSPAYLKSIVKVGNIEFEGEMSKDTEGSDFLKEILLDDQPGPVYVQIWGGTNTLARALKSIEDDHKRSSGWENIYWKVSRKTVIYSILDQDATYKKYVAPNWPDIRVIYNSAQFWSFAYMWNRVVPDNLKKYMNGDWFRENILFNHGPLLENYYTWGDGKKISGDPEHNQGDPEVAKKNKMQQFSFISEGDSPAYFFLLDFGLRSTEDPSYGGLGGRFVKSVTKPNRWEDGQNVTDFNQLTGKNETTWPQIRWIEVLQNDFAARADWCVNDYKNANHPPVVKLKHTDDISSTPGAIVKLNAVAKDPDGDDLNYMWWQYREAGTAQDELIITGKEEKNASFTVPYNATKGDTFHLILEVSDSGTPRLTRYRRVILTIV